MEIHQSAFLGGQMRKGGLHCHTTRSDGKGDPADVIRLHRAHGYDFLAITDHRVYNRTNFAPETGITILPAMEFDNDLESGAGFRTFHTVCIGADDETNPYTQDQRFESGTAKDQFEYQPYLDRLHQDSQMTIYCHPEWSNTPARYFDRQKGNFAMEIYNSSSVLCDEADANAAYWDELLGQGIRIFGVATDDGHGMHEHCRGWVMVRAENTVPAIRAALAHGDFYSSCGPMIRDFYIRDNMVCIDTSPCAKILFRSDKHPPRVFRPADDRPFTHAEFDFQSRGWAGPYESYIRAEVVDAEGRRAWTNPIFLHD